MHSFHLLTFQRADLCVVVGWHSVKEDHPDFLHIMWPYLRQVSQAGEALCVVVGWWRQAVEPHHPHFLHAVTDSAWSRVLAIKLEVTLSFFFFFPINDGFFQVIPKDTNELIFVGSLGGTRLKTGIIQTQFLHIMWPYLRCWVPGNEWADLCGVVGWWRQAVQPHHPHFLHIMWPYLRQCGYPLVDPTVSIFFFPTTKRVEGFLRSSATSPKGTCVQFDRSPPDGASRYTSVRKRTDGLAGGKEIESFSNFT